MGEGGNNHSRNQKGRARETEDVQLWFKQTRRLCIISGAVEQHTEYSVNTRCTYVYKYISYCMWGCKGSVACSPPTTPLTITTHQQRLFYTSVRIFNTAHMRALVCTGD